MVVAVRTTTLASPTVLPSQSPPQPSVVPGHAFFVYADVPDDQYLLDWSTRISPNLATTLGTARRTSGLSAALAQTLSWKPPAFAGLANSEPIAKGAQLKLL